MLNIELWRENMQDLQGSLKLVDEIDLMLRKRALDLNNQIYSKYINIDYLDIRSGINIRFSAKEMEFYVLDKIQKIAQKHNLEIDTNEHDFTGCYRVKIKFRKINEDDIVNE
jgi:methionine synthase II (cobalamin-independent)